MIRRAWPLLLLVPAAAAAIAYLSLGGEPWRADALLASRAELRALADAHPITTLIAFVAIYFAIISSALPVGPPMSLIAGFLFGRWIGTAAILGGATAGALVVYSVARLTAGTAFGARLRRRAGPVYDRVEADLRANAFGYLVVMRLVPFFPFFLVNVVAGLFGLPVRTFALATLLGRIPAAFLYASLGEEFGRVASLGELASGRVALTLTGMGALALLPVLLAHQRAGRDRPPE